MAGSLAVASPRPTEPAPFWPITINKSHYPAAIVVESTEIRGCNDDRNSIHRNLKEKKKKKKKKEKKGIASHFLVPRLRKIRYVNRSNEWWWTSKRMTRGRRNRLDSTRLHSTRLDSTRLDSVENLHRRCRFERPKIKIDGCDYGIKDESKSSRITSVGTLLWRKGTWNVIARPRNLCAGPNLHSQIVNSALTLTLSLRIFDSKLWLHVSSERREKEFGRGREKKWTGGGGD